MLNRTQHRFWFSFVALMVVLSMALSACGPRPELPDAAPAAEESAAEAEAAPAEEAAAPTEPAAESAAESDAAASGERNTQTEFNGAYNEAPMLKEMVAAGEIPALEDRLPKEPLMVEPYESIGLYGGTWRRAFLGVKDFHAWGRINYDPVLRWAPEFSDPIQPGLAKEWSWNDEGTELTLVFREGLKWSDGEPWTVDDIIFWWEHIELDTNITPSPHIEWTVNGEPMTLEKIDDVTIKFIFPGPSGIVESMGLAFHGNQWPLAFERFGVFAPKHYLEQFHPATNSDVTDYAVFEEAAFDYNVDRPVIWAWKPVQWDPGGTELILERNPYYWKTDTAGNQLPYIDRVHMALVENGEAVTVMAAAGEIDMQSRHLNLGVLPVLKENEAEGAYTVSLWSSDGASSIGLQPNQSYDDPQYRELMQNRDFRYALSLSIDRNLINDIVYLGQATVTNESVGPSTSWYVDDLGMFQADYDPAGAQALLEGMGLVKGDDGFYTFADGSELNLIIEADGGSPETVDALELITEQINEVGLKTTLKTMSRDLYWPRAIGNQVMINVWGTGSIFPLMNPDNLLAFNEKSFWGPQFGIWYQTNGASGEEPPDNIKKGQEIFNEILSTVDPVKQAELGKELVRDATENMWIINVAGRSPVVTLVKNNFKNVWTGPDYTASWIAMTPGNQNPATYYFDDSE
ncbi:MAG: ABC transporter substrate-binding protein [Caldilineaceae bacterium]|nr:ABC transporter substrate-binding protein [Caldilineaceae bacterium]